MKRLMMLALFGAVATCAPATAQVVTYDMSKLSCGTYVALDPDSSRDFSAWMSGWFNQKAGSTSINLEGYRKNVANVQSWCGSNPKANLMAGLQAAVANAKPGADGPTEINVGQITCGDFLKADVDTQVLVASWTGGWFMSTKGLTVVDPRYVKRNSKVIGEYCGKHKKEKLMSAIKKTWK